MSSIKEKWKSIDENYLISNYGNVYSKHRKRYLKKSKLGGYYFVRLSYGVSLIHRLIALHFIPNPNNYSDVDHIDRNPLNNNINNLRWISCSANILNSKLRTDNTTGHKGVYFVKRTKKWHARIKTNNKDKHLGFFNNIEDAIKARKKAEDMFWKQFNNTTT